MVRAFVVTSVLCLVACGPVVNIGAVCSTRDECGSGHSCITAAPGGFCSKSCADEGNVVDCPGGTVCTYFGASVLVCSVYCTETSQCRVNYQCAEVKGGAAGKKSCQPDNVTR